MIIFLPITLRETGGTSTFARKFQEGLASRGIKVIFTFSDRYDVLLASPLAPLRYLLHAKLKRRPIIHRLDGVYYPGTSAGKLWRLHNFPLRVIRNVFANHIIYQSEYSKISCEQYLGGPCPQPQSIIYNGVDTNIFSPEGSQQALHDNPDQHVFITASRFRRPDQIEPMIAAFTLYHQNYHANSKLVIIGNFDQGFKTLTLPPSVVLEGTVPNEKLPEYLRAADVFLFTHLNPPCPNNAIEAMACGLPICSTDTGAMPELVRHQQDGYLVQSPVDPAAFATAMQYCIQNQNALSATARNRALAKFTLDHMVDQYCTVMEIATSHE